MKVFFASLVALVVASVPAFAGYPVRVVAPVQRPVVIVNKSYAVQPVRIGGYGVSGYGRGGCCHFQRVVLPCGTVQFVRVCR
jgi:hypothetical protein